MKTDEIPRSQVAAEFALVRPLNGRDEMSIDAANPWAALDLVARLAPDLAVRDLDVTTADRLIANLYLRLYGDGCECHVRCIGCAEPYSFVLSLHEVIASQDDVRPTPDFADGCWSLPDGRKVRAPRVRDLELAPDELLGKVVVEGGAGDTEVLTFLERAAPTLALDLGAPCPHCHREQEVRFDVARYFAQRLAGERPLLLREIDLIAARYGWSLTEILELPRTDRRAFAALIASARPSPGSRRAR